MTKISQTILFRPALAPLNTQMTL